MTTMYVYETESKEIIAVVNAANNDNCEALATMHNMERDEYGWGYNDNGLTKTDETITLNDAEYITDPMFEAWEL